MPLDVWTVLRPINGVASMMEEVVSGGGCTVKRAPQVFVWTEFWWHGCCGTVEFATPAALERPGALVPPELCWSTLVSTQKGTIVSGLVRDFDNPSGIPKSVVLGVPAHITSSSLLSTRNSARLLSTSQT